jgi:hypothetical protein
LKQRVRDEMDIDRPSSKHAIEKLHSKIASKFEENLRHENEPKPMSVKLSYGSFFGEDNKNRIPSRASNVPSSGYFEIHNKSIEYFCVKVLIFDGDVTSEVPRPSFLSG